MKIIKKLIKMANFWPIVIVLLFGLLAGRSLITPGYFIMHDDLQMMRQLEMEKCFTDGQIPCRWVPDMGYGYGFPLFNFYPPLPYLIGQGVRLLSFSFVDTAKIVFLLSFLVSGVTMYLLAKEIFKSRLGGIVSAVFYIWAPYHSVDVYVRGAMNEAWALAWFPLILWTSYRLITEKKKYTGWVIALALSWFALFTSHNLMVLIFTPVFAGWCLLWLWRSKNLMPGIKYLAYSGFLALGLAAFFTLPAVFEQKLVHVDTLVVGYYEYIAHFADTNQLLFSRFWGYGPSIWGESDGMPFQIGHIHWITSLLIGIATWLFLKRKKIKINPHIFYIVFYFLIVGWLSLFMAHSRSTPIWQMIPPLKFVQFPWRFLTLSTLSLSFIAGFSVLILKKLLPRRYMLCAVILTMGLVAFNWNYFLPLGGKMGPLTDEEKFANAAWDLQRTAGIFDYLPKGARENPKGGQSVLAEIMEGEGKLSDLRQGTDWAGFKTEAAANKMLVRINVFDFPRWKVTLDGKQIEHFIPDTEAWGRMYIEVPEGNHEIYLKLFNTPIRTVSNMVSLVTWLGLISFPLWRKKMIQLKRG